MDLKKIVKKYHFKLFLLVVLFFFVRTKTIEIKDKIEMKEAGVEITAEDKIIKKENNKEKKKENIKKIVEKEDIEEPTIGKPIK